MGCLLLDVHCSTNLHLQVTQLGHHILGGHNTVVLQLPSHVRDLWIRTLAREERSVTHCDSSLQERKVRDVEEMFGLKEKALESLKERASGFAAMVAAFCQRLGYWQLELLVAKFQVEC